MKYRLSTLFIFFIITNILGQNLNEIYKQSIDAYKDKNFNSFKKLNLKALEIHPSHPTLLYNLALSYALLEDYDSAFNQISYLLSWNANLNIEEDTDLTNFLNTEEYKSQLILKKEMFSKTKIESNLFLNLSDKIHVEDFDISNNYILYSDLHNGMVSKFNLERNFLDSKAYFSSSPLSVVKDTSKEFIWISLSMIENYKFFDESKKNEASVVKIRIKDMKQVKEIKIPNKAVIGSLLAYGNKLFATSSLEPELYVIDTNNNNLEKIVDINEAYNLQGIVIDPKNEYLYIADYIKGIIRISLNNFSDRKWLENKNSNFLLKGIDGLVCLDSNTLLAVQNNSNPKRVIKIVHNSESINNIEIIDNALQTKGEPTNIKLTTEGVLYLSNSQWPFYDKHSKAIYKDWENQEIRFINNL